MDPDQGQRHVRPNLDLDCLHINTLNISEDILDAPQENCCCFQYINIYVNVQAINIAICLMLNKYIDLYCIYCIELEMNVKVSA